MPAITNLETPKIRNKLRFYYLYLTQTKKMFRRNIFSILVAAAIAYLSLSAPDNFNRLTFFNFRGADKVMHFLMYFGFMSVIVFENRKNIGKLKILFMA